MALSSLYHIYNQSYLFTITESMSINSIIIIIIILNREIERERERERIYIFLKTNVLLFLYQHLIKSGSVVSIYYLIKE